jgi:predicted XRE-type DNA-binding protein
MSNHHSLKIYDGLVYCINRKEGDNHLRERILEQQNVWIVPNTYMKQAKLMQKRALGVTFSIFDDSVNEVLETNAQNFSVYALQTRFKGKASKKKFMFFMSTCGENLKLKRQSSDNVTLVKQHSTLTQLN